jgi:hypothetical protein
MIKIKHPWVVVAGLLLMGVGMLLMMASKVDAQAPEAQDVCLARWVWNDQGENATSPFWEPPFRDNHLGTLNLRAVSDKGPGPTSTGWGLFSYDQPMGSTGMHCLGGDLDAPMTASQADTLALLLELEIGDIRARDMRNIIAELFLSHGDPTGQTRWKPVQTTRKGLIINLGGFGQIYGERFSETSRATQNTLDVRVADYRRLISEGMPLSQLQAQTGFDGFRIFGREPTSADLDRLLPPERRGDGYRCGDIERCTVFTESFNTADSDILGPDLTWTELGGTDIDIVSNRAHSVTSTGFARAEHDLAGADMYAQSNAFNTTSGLVRGPGSCVRYSAAADTAYYAQGNNNGSGSFVSYDIVERTAGTIAFIAFADGFTDADGGVIRTEITGSTIDVYYNGALRVSTTDASITGNTRGGICGRHTGVDRMEWDNFEVGDLGAVARRVIRVD